MGADPNVKDLFVEIGAMTAPAGTAYGRDAARVVDDHGHNHLPTPAVLKMVGDAFRDGPSGIKVHFDVGANYHGVGPDYASTDADEYIVPAASARGGESILEVPCVEDPTAMPPGTCQFPDYPGTVSWKIGYQLYRDAPVAADGSDLSPEGVLPHGEHMRAAAIRPHPQGHVPLRAVRAFARKAEGILSESGR